MIDLAPPMTLGCTANIGATAVAAPAASTASTKILLVDDDEQLLAMLSEYLERERFEVVCAHTGASGVGLALSGQYALVVLDVMMPGMNGVDALARIRAASSIPVLMLTARGDDIDRIVGLEIGADDYVAKPCSPRELTARIRGILRRAGTLDHSAERNGALVAGALTMWPERRLAHWNGQVVALTGAEFDLLAVLARKAGEPVEKRELSEAALGRPLARFDRRIDVHISSIRHKLGTLADGRACIQAVYRKGYQLLLE